MTAEPVRAGSDWLALREPADARARSTELVERLRSRLAPAASTLVHDLGSGTGSMLRWLVPRLPGRQHWVLHDRDADLLQGARAAPVPPASDGSSITFETSLDDVTRLGPRELDGSVVTASALLDMMTAAELHRLFEHCAAAGCPVLVALSVTGQVDLAPEDPLDAEVREAFNDHQRRDLGAGRLLGPDAVAAAADRFSERGYDVRTAPSPWRLGAEHLELTRTWLEGWVAAAVEQRPELAPLAEGYRERRLGQLSSGRLTAVVHHLDLLAIPGAPYPLGPAV
jgi:trans-aconitate methyltransferase